MQIQLTAYVVRLILAYESEAEFLEVLMAIRAFMVLIVLTLLKRLKIWTPVVKESALDSRGGLFSADGGGFQCSGLVVQVWARHSFCSPGARFCALHSALGSLSFWSCTEDLQFCGHQLLGFS